MESDASNTGARKGINTEFDPGHLTQTKHGGHTGCRVGRNCHCCAALHACMHYHAFFLFMMTLRCSAVSPILARRGSAKSPSLASGALSYTCIHIPCTCMCVYTTVREAIHVHVGMCAYVVIYRARSAVAIWESFGACPPCSKSFRTLTVHNRLQPNAAMT